MKLISRLFSRLDLPQINIFRTVIFNFTTLPLKQAVKFPIFLYGKVRFYSLEGKIKIEGPVITKMIKIGANRGLLSGYDKSTSIALFKGGSILFKGNVDIGMGSFLRIGGDLSIENNVDIGADCRIFCDYIIELEEEVHIAFQSRIMDTNFHPLINIETREVYPIKKAVKIGAKSWVASCTHIMPGSVIKKETIVSSNSMVNKDFSKSEGDKMVLGGVPARILRTGMLSIHSSQLEDEIMKHYMKYPDIIYMYRGML